MALRPAMPGATVGVRTPRVPVAALMLQLPRHPYDTGVLLLLADGDRHRLLAAGKAGSWGCVAEQPGLARLTELGVCDAASQGQIHKAERLLTELPPALALEALRRCGKCPPARRGGGDP
eukprot:gene2295-39075_t